MAKFVGRTETSCDFRRAARLTRGHHTLAICTHVYR